MKSPELILTWMSGSQDGQTVRLVAGGSPPQVTLGRMPACTLSLPQEPDASRQHARLTYRDEGWWIEDLGSTNGTFMGEFDQSVRVTSPTPVLPGQIFRLGHVRFRLERGESDAVAGRQLATDAAIS